VKWIAHTAWQPEEPDKFCHFGITESILGASLASIFGGGLEAAGVGAETAGVIGGVGSGAVTGAGIGATGSALLGGDPGTGALTGALTGGAVGGAGAAGLGTVGEIAAGAGAGAAGAGITGGSPLFGSITGGGAGLVAGLTGAATPSTGGAAIEATPASGSSGGTSAVAPGPVSVPSGSSTPMDLTSNTFGISGPSGGDWFSNLFGGTSQPGVGPDAIRNPGGMANLPGGGLSPSGLPLTSAAGAAEGTGGGDIGSKIMGLVEKNPGVLLGAGVLGANALLGDRQLPAEQKLNQAAGEAATTGRTLSSYIFSGTLPQGAQQAVDSATNAAKARVRSSYAGMGLANSTMEAQALQQIDQSAAAQVFQMADQLLARGADYAKLSDSLYQTLLQTQAQQEGDFTKSLGLFAAGLAGAKLNG
jgi:hypothetical protein